MSGAPAPIGAAPQLAGTFEADPPPLGPPPIGGLQTLCCDYCDSRGRCDSFRAVLGLILSGPRQNGGLHAKNGGRPPKKVGARQKRGAAKSV